MVLFLILKQVKYKRFILCKIVHIYSFSNTEQLLSMHILFVIGDRSACHIFMHNVWNFNVFL